MSHCPNCAALEKERAALEKERDENHKAYVTVKEWAHGLEYQLIEVVEVCEEAAKEEPAGSFPDNLIGTINKLVLGELTSKHQHLEQDRDAYKAALRECAVAVKKNHQWHLDYDEYDGYPECDLCQTNLKALSNPIVQQLLKEQ